MPLPQMQGEIAFTFKITRPADPNEIGKEAIRLAQTIARLSRAQYVEITEPIRMGFKSNFDTESAAGDPWPELAEMTINERDQLLQGGGSFVPGFGPEHPILQRTGSYKQSWIDAQDPDHLLEIEERTATSGGLTFGYNKVDVFVGSKDPRVPKLSGAFWGMAEQEAFDLFGEMAGDNPGVVPPRPVHGIPEGHSAVVGWILDYILAQEAEKVK